MQETAFNLMDEERKIRLVEAKSRCGDPMSLDVRGNVFVVRKGASEGGIIRMWLRVVPVQPVTFLLHPVTVGLDHAPSKVQVFPYAEDDSPVKLDLTSQLGNSGATPNHHEGRTTDGGEGLRETVDKTLVSLDIGEHLSFCGVQGWGSDAECQLGLEHEGKR